jgi:anhydro-N-acetylmuramic acid kinase
MDKYNAIGLMSGTSLDGLDIAACEFILSEGKWSFKIKFCRTLPYSKEWISELEGLAKEDALTFSYANIEYGHLIGKMTQAFINETHFIPDLIASHGHTIFHRPDKGLTLQIGSGSVIAAETGFPVVCDFRSADVALGGQGAPLVPVGDRMLFPEYDACLNLGGFANVSMELGDERIAFDICPVNIVLNRIASSLGMDYDKDGLIARSGHVDYKLLKQLDNLEYYYQKWPKSLGKEWLETEFLPIAESYVSTPKNLMRTVCEHVAGQIKRTIPIAKDTSVLVTGGGTHNRFLMERICYEDNRKWIIPQDEWIDYKEALVFAFLGVLRLRNEPNILRSVTGCRINHSGGAIYSPF